MRRLLLLQLAQASSPFIRGGPGRAAPGTHTAGRPAIPAQHSAAQHSVHSTLTSYTLPEMTSHAEAAVLWVATSAIVMPLLLAGAGVGLGGAGVGAGVGAGEAVLPLPLPPLGSLGVVAFSLPANQALMLAGESAGSAAKGAGSSTLSME